MSLLLQFNHLTQNETAKEAMDNYVGFLKKAFEQYRDLWEDYIKLQENHKQCNISSASQVTIVEPCIKKEEKSTVETQLNSIIVEESGNNSLLVDSSHTNTQDFFDDMDSDLANLSEDFLDNSPQRSPVFSKTYRKTSSTFAKKLLQSPEATSVSSKSTADTKMFHKGKVSAKCKQNLDISTSYYVETIFLPNNKKLKQTRLMFHPVKHDKDKTPDTMQKAKQDVTNTLNIKESVTIEDKATETNETFEDVTEISPTQRDIQSKSKHCLRLKRKVPGETIKDIDIKNKNKYHSFESNYTTKTAIDDTDFSPCLLPKLTSVQMMCNKFLAKNSNVVNTLKHNNIIDNPSLIHKSDKANVKNTKSIDNQRQSQTVKDEVQNVSQNSINMSEEETFYLPAENKNKNDTDFFILNDVENEPPVKKLSLNKFHVLLKKENEPEQLNMRCKADRAKLNGWACWECEQYYKNLSLSKEELQKRKNQCSRHRRQYERPSTPEGFWDPEFPETLSSTYRHNM